MTDSDPHLEKNPTNDSKEFLPESSNSKTREPGLRDDVLTGKDPAYRIGNSSWWQQLHHRISGVIKKVETSNHGWPGVFFRWRRHSLNLKVLKVEEKHIRNALLQYVEAMHSGDRETFQPTFTVDPMLEIVAADYILETLAFINKFEAAYGHGLHKHLNIKSRLIPTLKDVEFAEIVIDGETAKATMLYGVKTYTLISRGHGWLVRDPDEFLISGISSIALATHVTSVMRESRSMIIGQDVPAEIIAATIAEALQDALGPDYQVLAEEPDFPEEVQPIFDSADMAEPSLDKSLRAELESVYNKFIMALKDSNFESLLHVLKMPSSDEEVFQKTAESENWDRHVEWMLTMNPELSQTTFITLNSLANDFAGYFFLWDPSYSDDYKHVSIRKFEKTRGQWRMLYSLGEGNDAILQVGPHDDVQTKVYELLETSPFLKLVRPAKIHAPERKPGQTLENPDEIKLKAELEAIDEAQRDALKNKDIDGFLSTVSLSKENLEQLKARFLELAEDILTSKPMLSQTTFVTTKTIMDKNIVGYYYMADYPHDKAFLFVYLKMFVKREGRWRMLLNMDPLFKPDVYALQSSGGNPAKLLIDVDLKNLAVSLNHSKSDGDIQSRAMELIDQNLLQMDSLFPICFEEVIRTEVHSAIKSEDYPAVLTLSRPFLEQESAWAQSAVGFLYSKGKGVEQDCKTSLKLLQSATTKGSLKARILNNGRNKNTDCRR